MNNSVFHNFWLHRLIFLFIWYMHLVSLSHFVPWSYSMTLAKHRSLMIHLEQSVFRFDPWCCWVRWCELKQCENTNLRLVALGKLISIPASDHYILGHDRIRCDPTFPNPPLDSSILCQVSLSSFIHKEGQLTWGHLNTWNDIFPCQ